jgi:hypothetical protein
VNIPIRCEGRNGNCQSLAAKREGRYITIRHVHHGQIHLTRIDLTELLALTAERDTLLSR